MLSEEDKKWIDKNIKEETMNDVLLDEASRNTIDQEGDYELTIFLSTDGKHTVNGRAITPEGKRKMYSAVSQVYDQILEKYGTKQAQAVKAYNKEEDLGTCNHCGAPNAKSLKGKIYCSAKCWLKE